jgi:hypothetical protein
VEPRSEEGHCSYFLRGFNMFSRPNTLVAAACATCLTFSVMGSANAGETPTVSEFLNAANALYLIDATPAGMSRFTSNGAAVMLDDETDGAFADVFITKENQLIISYQGTTGGLNFLVNPIATVTQVVTDIQVVEEDDLEGNTPAGLTTSLSFAKSVIALANAQGFSTSNIFVTGHSLGGIEAEFVASQTGIGGIGFESTGISNTPVAGATGSNFVDSVTFGDPVGNFSSDIDALQPNAPPFVANGGQAPHYGNIVFLGTPSDETTLINDLSGASIENLADDLTLLDLVLEFHLPGVQAHDLNVTLNPSSDLVDGLGDMAGEVENWANLQIPALISAASAAGRLTKG